MSDDLLPDDAALAENGPGEYVVVARRYRPQTFAELVGQQHVAQALVGAIQTDRVGHAYLFTGARGVGKTSAARIFAKALDCVAGPTPTPCNECDVCQGITSGDDVDVIEIDGASNNSVEDIRDLRQNVNVRPSRARLKIYIIDEVHMLSKSAFNALLKTLEEPPEHVKFIFCTTEPEKIPITILSRCQRFDFAGVETTMIAQRLSQIVETEGVQVEPEALDLLARRAAGSMRDSQSLLEQILASGGKSITVDDVQRLLGIAADTRLASLVEHLVARNAAGALAELDGAVRKGVDVGQLVDQLMGWLRDLLAASVGCPTEALLYVSPSRMAEVATLGPQIGVHTLLAMLQMVEQAAVRLKQSTHGRTVVELALIRICKLDELDELSFALESLKGGASAPLSSPRPAAIASPQRPQPSLAEEAAALKKNGEVSPPRESRGIERREAEALAEPLGIKPVNPVGEPTGSPVAPPSRPSVTLTEAQARALWSRALGEFSDMLADHASMAERITASGNRITVGFPKKYNLPKSFCELSDQTARLEQALSAAAGGPLKLDFVLFDAPASEAQSAAARGPTPHERLREKSQLPFVRKALELFDARAVRVDDGE